MCVMFCYFIGTPYEYLFVMITRESGNVDPKSYSVFNICFGFYFLFCFAKDFFFVGDKIILYEILFGKNYKLVDWRKHICVAK